MRPPSRRSRRAPRRPAPPSAGRRKGAAALRPRRPASAPRRRSPRCGCGCRRTESGPPSIRRGLTGRWRRPPKNPGLYLGSSRSKCDHTALRRDRVSASRGIHRRALRHTGAYRAQSFDWVAKAKALLAVFRRTILVLPEECPEEPYSYWRTMLRTDEDDLMLLKISSGQRADFLADPVPWQLRRK